MGVMDRVLLSLDTITRNDLSYGVITAIVLNDPLEITTSASHGLVTGDRVYVAGIVGTTEINNQVFTVTKKDADEITLDGVDGTTGHTAWVSGGEVAPLIGSMGNISHGNTEGMIPLLNSTGKFDAARLPNPANNGLARVSGRVDLSSGSPTTVVWTGLAAGTSILVVDITDVIVNTTSAFVSFQLGHSAGPTWVTSGYSDRQGFRITWAAKLQSIGPILANAGWGVPGEVQSSGPTPPISAHVWMIRQGVSAQQWSVMCNTAYGILSSTVTLPAEMTSVKLIGHTPASPQTMTGFAQLWTN